jgi:ABC-type bacteriocin/lantibiotic exporter with double-glycine peptidase domain
VRRNVLVLESQMKWRWANALLLSLVVCVSSVCRGEDVGVKADSWDCGTLSLYHLLRLEGRAVGLERLRSLLGEMPTDGYSFRELRDAANRCGLALDAVVLPKARSAIRGPMLVFLKGSSEGHFVVMRPVGHTGKLVQLIDGDLKPSVLDADQLFNAPAWKGLALVPRRINIISVVLACVSFACFGAILAKFRREMINRRGESKVLSNPSVA